MSERLTAALEAAGCGLPVFPCRGKLPAIKGWQTKASTDGRKVIALWERNPEANIGVATRKLIVLDTDNDHAEEWLRSEIDPPDTATSRTRRGRHRYYRASVPKGCLPNLHPGVDVKGNRNGYPTGLVLAPGSEVSGHRYRWEIHPQEAGIVEAPAELVKLVEKRELRELVSSDNPIREGTRNAALATIAGRLHHYFDLSDAGELYQVIAGINERRCKPPLPEHEIREIAESISRYGCQPWQRRPAEVAQWVADPRLSTNARFVLRIGCDYANHRGEWDLSRKQIADLTSRSNAQVKRAIRELQVTNRIKVRQRNAKSGRSRTSLKILLPTGVRVDTVQEGGHIDPLPPRAERRTK